jgi:hypothetical protein
MFMIWFLGIKHNYLIALSYLLRNVRKQVLISELPPVSRQSQYTTLNIQYSKADNVFMIAHTTAA